MDFTGSAYVSTHRRWYERWLYRLDDGVTPVPDIELFGLAGTLRSVASAPSVILDLTPYLAWSATESATLVLDIPDAIMAGIPKGRYELEIVALGDVAGDSRELIVANVDVRLAVHRA